MAPSADFGVFWSRARSPAAVMIAASPAARTLTDDS
jgi:hypothetical protein